MTEQGQQGSLNVAENHTVVLPFNNTHHVYAHSWYEMVTLTAAFVQVFKNCPVMKFFFCLITALCIIFTCSAQKKSISDSLQFIDKNEILTATQKLVQIYRLKKTAESSIPPGDTLYAKILNTAGLYEFLANTDYNAAIKLTLAAAAINIAAENKEAIFLAVRNYANLGFYYDKMQQFAQAIAYYDTTIALAKKISGRENLLLDAEFGKTYIFFRSGDYQKAVEESTLGIAASLAAGDSLRYLDFLNQRGQSLFFQDQLQQSLTDIETAIPLAEKFRQPHRLASAEKMKGFIYACKRDFIIAEIAYKKSIKARLETNDYGQIAGDYNDFGNFYFDSIGNYLLARANYTNAISYAMKRQDSVRLSRINLNIGRTFLEENNTAEAEKYFLKSLAFLRLNTNNSLLYNPFATTIAFMGNKELLLSIFDNKTALLLRRYKSTMQKMYLSACISTAQLTDSLITQVRHEQSGEQSKLYWRNRTRGFFANALEACYIAGNTKLAFYFLEKSRAVLLNDKLNELGASAHLPTQESIIEQRYRLRIINEQQKLNSAAIQSPDYSAQQLILLQAKEEFEHYIHTLEQKYPAYYQYKYADDVPALEALQNWLLKTNQNFVHYFVYDTTAYMLAITPATIKMVKLQKQDFDIAAIATFVQVCSDKQHLNNNYTSFATLSNRLYNIFFKPLQLTGPRIIICQDSFLLPFDALCSDENGRDFLIYKYIFSYVYSARYLMQSFKAGIARGNFIGFAPVSFQLQLGLPELKQSALSLRQAASYYNATELLTGMDATRSNFIKRMSEYKIVNVFSHAVSDSGGREPLLYMQDSAINLSELQLIQHPATKLIVLSACQTNAGRNAAGEGIYSLARGFSSAGIPAVAATLWKADEETIYIISGKFHEYLSRGMNKDEALQKAKIYFMKSGGNEKLLPYFWANMIIMGNAEPVVLLHHSTGKGWMIAAVILLLSTIATVIFRIRKEANGKNLFS